MVRLGDARAGFDAGRLNPTTRTVLAGAEMLEGTPRRSQWLMVSKELSVMFLAALAYFAVRGLTEGSKADALTNAYRIEDFERWLGILVEPELQNWITHSTLLVNLVNWTYIWAHWPLIAVVAGWLILRHPEQYRLTRSAFLISGGLGLVVFATFPVAPPRLTDLDVVDTVTENSRAYRILQPPAFTNQYAAMPSLHFGWNLLIGIAIFRVAGRMWVKTLAVLIPVAMGTAVVLTANHYILDAVAGALFALAGLWLAQLLRQRATERRRRKAEMEMRNEQARLSEQVIADG